VIQIAGADPLIETPPTGACQFMTMSSHASHAGVNVRTDRSLRVDVAIPAALDVEEAAIVEAIGDCSVVRWKGLSLHLGTVAGQRVLVFPIGGMGNAGAAQATERVIGVWNPARVMLVGIAGGAPGSSADMRPGDILVPDQVVGYELAKVTPGDTARRYEVYRPDVELLARARSLRPTDWADAIGTPRPDDPERRIRPLVHVGPVLTGDKVLADRATLARLRLAWPKAIGIEMESLGVALAAYQNGPGFLMVKAVSDFADGTKNDAWHRYAAEAAARFAVAVLAGSSPAAGPGRAAAAPPGKTGKTYPGRVKVAVCQRLHADWEDVADIFDVPLHVKARFRHGQQPRDLWEWLEVRMRLHALPAALNEIGRSDLADVLQSAEP
jgi:nucleoside phosphorylase